MYLRQGSIDTSKRVWRTQISENTYPLQGSIDTSKRALKSQTSENTYPRQGSIDTSKRTLKTQISENTCPRQGSIDTSKRALKSQICDFVLGGLCLNLGVYELRSLYIESKCPREFYELGPVSKAAAGNSLADEAGIAEISIPRRGLQGCRRYISFRENVLL